MNPSSSRLWAYLLVSLLAVGVGACSCSRSSVLATSSRTAPGAAGVPDGVSPQRRAAVGPGLAANVPLAAPSFGPDRRALDALLDELADGPATLLKAADLFARWAQVDPAGAIEHAAAQPQLHGRPELAGELLRAWLARDDAAARRWLLALPPGGLRSSLLPTLMAHCAGRDPVAALRLLDTMGGAHREPLLAAVFSTWARQDLRAALAAAWTLPGVVELHDPPAEDPALSDQQVALVQIAAVWSQRDPAAAGAWLLQLPPGVGARLAPALLGRWAEAAPSDVARYLDALPHDDHRGQLLAALARQWTKVDLSAALSWVVSQPDVGQRALLARTMVAELGETRLEDAADLALALPLDAARGETLAMVLARWLARDRSAIDAWARQQVLADSRRETLALIIGSWNAMEPATLRAWVESWQDGPPGDEVRAAYVEISGGTKSMD